MIQRCTNPKHKHYNSYGGRGITVCKEWESFEAFLDWALKNGYSDTLEIDRKENDGNYEPGNCRFITHLENCHNQNRRADNGIYNRRGGFEIALTHNGKYHYGGFVKTLFAARIIRNELINKFQSNEKTNNH